MDIQNISIWRITTTTRRKITKYIVSISDDTEPITLSVVKPIFAVICSCMHWGI